MDYIFDWARDLYRPSILRSLEAFAGLSYDDSASLAADSDIFSSRKNPRADDMTEVGSIADIDVLDTTASDESLLIPWRQYDLKSSRGVCSYDLRVIRPSYIIKSAFQCLYITGDNIGTLMLSLGSNHHSRTKMARDALAALRSGPMLVTERILSQIEDTWTGTPRMNRSAEPEHRVYCSFAYAASISDSWELTRIIMCFAVDQSALDTIRQNALLKKEAYLLGGLENKGQTIDEKTFETFLGTVSSRNDKRTLSYAISRVSETWKPGKLLTLVEREQIGRPVPDDAMVRTCDVGADRFIRKVIHDTYKRHKQPGLLEPNFPYLRFSARLDRLETRTDQVEPVKYLLGARHHPPKILPDSAILVCNEQRNSMHLCVYTTQAYPSPPEIVDIFQILTTATTATQLFVHGRSQWNAEKNELEADPRVHQRELLLELKILCAAHKWLSEFCERFDTEFIVESRNVLDGLKLRLESFREILGDGNLQFSEILDSPRPFVSNENDDRPAKARRQKQISLDPRVLDSPPRRGTVHIMRSPEAKRGREISKILVEANGDHLADDKILCLMELGYFK